MHALLLTCSFVVADKENGDFSFFCFHDRAIVAEVGQFQSFLVTKCFSLLRWPITKALFCFKFCLVQKKEYRREEIYR